ncbi:hypothetical protein C9439_02365 [archaeon SCG-AAA382B04]|nr:hypothetical protein C9439_02365 [archaeon SCG-AAA382B04]
MKKNNYLEKMNSKKPEKLFEYLILCLIQEKDNYGYGLIKEIREISGGYWDPSYGTIYGTLSRLEENEGIERVEKGHEDRKYFKITKKGNEKLKDYQKNSKEFREKSEEMILGLMNVYRRFNEKEKFFELIEKIISDFEELDSDQLIISNEKSTPSTE